MREGIYSDNEDTNKVIKVQHKYLPSWLWQYGEEHRLSEEQNLAWRLALGKGVFLSDPVSVQALMAKVCLNLERVIADTTAEQFVRFLVERHNGKAGVALRYTYLNGARMKLFVYLLNNAAVGSDYPSKTQAAYQLHSKKEHIHHQYIANDWFTVPASKGKGKGKGVNQVLSEGPREKFMLLCEHSKGVTVDRQVLQAGCRCGYYDWVMDILASNTVYKLSGADFAAGLDWAYKGWYEKCVAPRRKKLVSEDPLVDKKKYVENMHLVAEEAKLPAPPSKRKLMRLDRKALKAMLIATIEKAEHVWADRDEAHAMTFQFLCSRGFNMIARKSPLYEAKKAMDNNLLREAEHTFNTRYVIYKVPAKFNREYLPHSADPTMPTFWDKLGPQPMMWCMIREFL